MSGLRPINSKTSNLENRKKKKARVTLSQHYPLVKSLLNADRGFWRYTLQNLSRSQYEFLKKLAQHFMRGKLPVTESNFSRLRNKRTSLRQIVAQRTPESKKIKIIQQHGEGIFSILIPTLASVIGGLLAK